MNGTVRSCRNSRPREMENPRQYLLLRTDILQKTVVGCPCSERVEQKRHRNAYEKHDIRPFLLLKKHDLNKNGAKTEQSLSIMSFRCASGKLLLYYKHGSLTSYMHDVLNCSYKLMTTKNSLRGQNSPAGPSSGRGTLYFKMRGK